MTRRGSTGGARLAGAVHELELFGDDEKREMDFHNNDCGIDASGSAGSCADACEGAPLEHIRPWGTPRLPTHPFWTNEYWQ